MSSDGQGALNLARKTLTEALGNTGFIDVTGPRIANFETYIRREPVELDVEDLKPGMLVELAAWVAQELGNNPQQALEAQARVRPEAALKLLT